MLREKRIDDFFKLALGTRPHQPLDRLTVLEEENGRNAHHLIASGNFRVLIGIELTDLDLAGIFCC